MEKNRLSQPGMSRPKGQHEVIFVDGGSILGLGVRVMEGQAALPLGVKPSPQLVPSGS